MRLPNPSSFKNLNFEEARSANNQKPDQARATSKILHLESILLTKRA